MKKIFSHSLTDHKNPIWLEILRLILVGGSLLMLIITVLVALYLFLDNLVWDFFLAISSLLGIVLGGGLVIGLYYIVGMIALNTAFNLQQIRINTDKTNQK